MNLIVQSFFQLLDQHENIFKKDKSKIKFLTDIDILLMVEKGLKGGICHSIYRYAKANNKHMKNFDKNKES